MNGLQILMSQDATYQDIKKEKHTTLKKNKQEAKSFHMYVMALLQV